MFLITHKQDAAFRATIQKFLLRDRCELLIVFTYTVDVSYTLKYYKMYKIPILIVYGAHATKDTKKQMQQASKKYKQIQFVLGSCKLGRMHAKMMMLIGNKHMQLLISTANFANNKRSQNAFYRSPIIRISKRTSKNKRHSFASTLQQFFRSFTHPIQAVINQSVHRYTFFDSLNQVLSRTDFREVRNVYIVVTTPPQNHKKDDTIGFKAMGDILKRHRIQSSLTTIQPTSFGVHLNDEFWKYTFQSLHCTRDTARVVVPKLCVHSTVQKKRLQCVPQRLRNIFEDLVWKEQEYNKEYKKSDKHLDPANVPHFKLYYGSNKAQTKVDWICFSSMSLSLGACGRYVCPVNPTQRSSKKCTCQRKRLVGRNFELGLLFVPKTTKEKTRLAEIVPFY